MPPIVGLDIASYSGPGGLSVVRFPELRVPAICIVKGWDIYLEIRVGVQRVWWRSENGCVGFRSQATLLFGGLRSSEPDFRRGELRFTESLFKPEPSLAPS